MTEELCREFVEKMRIPTFDEDAKVVVETLTKVVSNVVRFPGEPRFRSLRLENPVVSKMVGLYEKSLEYLLLLGFEYETVDIEQRITLINAEENKPLLKIGLAVLEETALDLGISKEHLDGVLGRADENSVKSFNPYSSMVVNLAPAPKPSGGNTRMEKEVARLKQKREEVMEAAGIPERKLRVFEPTSNAEARRFSASRLGSLAPVKKSSSKSDNELLKEVIQTQQESQRRSQKFSTKAMRDLEKLKHARVFTRTLIRVQFPDRTMVEMWFSPAEIVADVLAEVNKCLKSAKDTPIYLYQTPPLRKLDLTMTLDKCGLKPAALIYAGWEKGTPAGEYLCADLTAILSQQKGQKVKPADHFPQNSVRLIEVQNIMNSPLAA
eukprot:CAMPEP_0204843576 /NCGR_PEP_ID=MMETSP1346-20131115/48059_1 /ASSEMBLY_ACC=CAM_ASM_000771 /TAXON_ID=215587 /ORGANISM="Aplanochytrium stocchinoi, Strain GSBS06" /LENGTH=380 /DNA_ID=CAMNT_0051982739 /DNA_START=246 /DNA_END=1388 /DNA_ORIENTATION=+